MNTRLNTVNSLMAKTLRVNGLGLSQNEIDDWLGIARNRYSQWENGARRFPTEVVEKLEELIGTRDTWADEMVHAAVGYLPKSSGGFDGPLGRWSVIPAPIVELPTYVNDNEFWRARPECDGIPAGVHRSATALAWSRLRAAGVAAVILDATGGES